MLSVTYRVGAKVVHRLPLRAGKLGESLGGRRGAADRWVTWARTARPAGRLVWIHAASVGEAQAAEPVMRRLHRAWPDAACMLTASSPTLARWPHTFGAVRLDFVPLDEPDPIERVLDALGPCILIVSRGDLWPELVSQSCDRDIPTAVIAGAIRSSSRRLQWPARRILKPIVRKLTWVGAITESDAVRWRALGARPDVVAVTGDPRHDAVLERLTTLDEMGSLVSWSRRHTVMVAGSVEPSDHDILIAAYRRVRVRHVNAALLLVPHEPNEHIIQRLTQKLEEAGIASEVWRRGASTPTQRCVVVSSRGLLADLYVLADLSYVGGGFRRRHLHAVIEPAAYGVPVLFGPHWQDFADAAALRASGGGVVVDEPAAPEALADRWSHYLSDRAERTAAGLSARATLHEGAAHQTVRGLRPLLDARGRTGK